MVQNLLASGADYLFVEVTGQGADVQVVATLGQETKTQEIKDGKKDIQARFLRIYDILQEKKKKELGTLKSEVSYLSEQLIAPLSGMLEKTQHVVFRIDKTFVRAPLDLLESNGTPIFLSHSVTYVASKFKLSQKPFPKIESGYLMADLTCDPEYGLKQVAKTLPNATYVEMKDASLASIKKAGKSNDVLVLSAHGGIDNKNSGGVSINQQDLYADFVTHLDVNLAYFDSCQMGAAWDFVEEFVDNQSSIYYLAPIISNDAGDSSTLTVKWFFEDLNLGKSPADALAQTRRKLYNFYKDKNLHEVVVLNKAFAFRLYEFDQM